VSYASHLFLLEYFGLGGLQLGVCSLQFTILCFDFPVLSSRAAPFPQCGGIVNRNYLSYDSVFVAFLKGVHMKMNHLPLAG